MQIAVTSVAPRSSRNSTPPARQRSAGREHRVEHEALAVAQVIGKALGVRRRLEGDFVAGHAEEADLGARQQLDHSLEHAEAGSQDRTMSGLGSAMRTPVVGDTGVTMSTGSTRTPRVPSYASRVMSSSTSARKIGDGVFTSRRTVSLWVMSG